MRSTLNTRPDHLDEAESKINMGDIPGANAHSMQVGPENAETRHVACGLRLRREQEGAVADEARKSKDERQGEPPDRQKDNEWLRDQVGEDTNLSGSTTFRTLPDQPDQTGRDDRDAEERQSKR